MKNIYLGIGTTGLDFNEDDIIKLSLVTDLNEVLNLNIRPRAGKKPSSISQIALDMNRVSIEDLRSFEPPSKLAYDVVLFLKKTSDDGKNQLRIISHNLDFDIRFLSNLIKNNTDYSLFKYVDNKTSVSLITHLPFVEALTDFRFKDYKFKTLCDLYEIPFQPSDTESKARATKILVSKILGVLAEARNDYEEK